MFHLCLAFCQQVEPTDDSEQNVTLDDKSNSVNRDGVMPVMQEVDAFFCLSSIVCHWLCALLMKYYINCGVKKQKKQFFDTEYNCVYLVYFCSAMHTVYNVYT